VTKSELPASVNSSLRVSLRNSGKPRSSSSALIWRLTAPWVRPSSSAASVMLSRRPTASKARSVCSGWKAVGQGRLHT